MTRRQEPKPKPRSSYQLELGSTALLSLFFAFAVVCGLFFSFGYTLGKHAVPATFSLGGSPPASAEAKPLASLASAPPAPSGVQAPNPAQLGAAESNQTPATLTPPSSAAPPAEAPPPATTDTSSTTTSSSTASAPLPVAVSPAASSAPLGSSLYHVQVFAGIQTDALSLAAALQQRGYPAMVVLPSPGVDLYRVQVGPYLTAEEAQAVRSRLTADGYQAIIKQ